MLQNYFNQWDCSHNFTTVSFKPLSGLWFLFENDMWISAVQKQEKKLSRFKFQDSKRRYLPYYYSDRALNGFVVNQKCHLIIHGSTFSLVQFYNVKNIRNSHVHNICGCSTVVYLKDRTGFKEARASCTVWLYRLQTA